MTGLVVEVAEATTQPPPSVAPDEAAVSSNESVVSTATPDQPPTAKSSNKQALVSPLQAKRAFFEKAFVRESPRALLPLKSPTRRPWTPRQKPSPTPDVLAVKPVAVAAAPKAVEQAIVEPKESLQVAAVSVEAPLTKESTPVEKPAAVSIAEATIKPTPPAKSEAAKAEAVAEEGNEEDVEIMEKKERDELSAPTTSTTFSDESVGDLVTAASSRVEDHRPAPINTVDEPCETTNEDLPEFSELKDMWGSKAAESRPLTPENDPIIAEANGKRLDRAESPSNTTEEQTVETPTVKLVEPVVQARAPVVTHQEEKKDDVEYTAVTRPNPTIETTKPPTPKITVASSPRLPAQLPPAAMSFTKTPRTAMATESPRFSELKQMWGSKVSREPWTPKTPRSMALWESNAVHNDPIVVYRASPQPEAAVVAVKEAAVPKQEDTTESTADETVVTEDVMAKEVVSAVAKIKEQPSWMTEQVMKDAVKAASVLVVTPVKTAVPTSEAKPVSVWKKPTQIVAKPAIPVNAVKKAQPVTEPTKTMSLQPTKEATPVKTVEQSQVVTLEATKEVEPVQAAKIVKKWPVVNQSTQTIATQTSLEMEPVKLVKHVEAEEPMSEAESTTSSKRIVDRTKAARRRKVKQFAKFKKEKEPLKVPEQPKQVVAYPEEVVTKSIADASNFNEAHDSDSEDDFGDLREQPRKADTNSIRSSAAAMTGHAKRSMEKYEAMMAITDQYRPKETDVVNVAATMKYQTMLKVAKQYRPTDADDGAASKKYKAMLDVANQYRPGGVEEETAKVSPIGEHVKKFEAFSRGVDIDREYEKVDAPAPEVEEVKPRLSPPRELPPPEETKEEIQEGPVQTRFAFYTANNDTLSMLEKLSEPADTVAFEEDQSASKEKPSAKGFVAQTIHAIEKSGSMIPVDDEEEDDDEITRAENETSARKTSNSYASRYIENIGKVTGPEKHNNLDGSMMTDTDGLTTAGMDTSLALDEETYDSAMALVDLNSPGTSPKSDDLMLSKSSSTEAVDHAKCGEGCVIL
jgi:hypothetical protein